MNTCPKHGVPLTPLFTGLVCDVCDGLTPAPDDDLSSPVLLRWNKDWFTQVGGHHRWVLFRTALGYQHYLDSCPEIVPHHEVLPVTLREPPRIGRVWASVLVGSPDKTIVHFRTIERREWPALSDDPWPYDED